MLKTVLFIGSDPNYNRPDSNSQGGADHIDIRRERKVLQTVYDAQKYFRFVAAEHCTWDDLKREVATHKPSILHICSHGVQIGEESKLLFVDEDANGLEAGADFIVDTLQDCHSLELVFLDACRSSQLAERICNVQTRFFCVGYENDVPVRASTRGSGYFHTEISGGACVNEATEALRLLQESIPSWNKAEARFHRPASRSDRPIRPRAQILAKFFEDDPSLDATGAYTINFGLDLQDGDIPSVADDTYLVCFFSDERDYIEKEYVTLIKDDRSRAPFWHRKADEERWDYDNDADVFCTYVHLRSGFAETLSCKASVALKRYYENKWLTAPKGEDIEKAIVVLERA